MSEEQTTELPDWITEHIEAAHVTLNAYNRRTWPHEGNVYSWQKAVAWLAEDRQRLANQAKAPYPETQMAFRERRAFCACFNWMMTLLGEFGGSFMTGDVAKEAARLFPLPPRPEA
jgi:hypothetical protein